MNNAPLAGRANGGRVAAAAGTKVTLDRKTTASAGDRLIINLPTGKAEGRTIKSVSGRAVTVDSAYSTLPNAESAWVIDQQDLAIQLFRVRRVAIGSDDLVTISGLPYNPNKFPKIDDGAIVEDRPVTVVPPGNQAMPTNIEITSEYRVDQGIGINTMVATWDPVANAVAYEVQWRQNSGDWINANRTGNTRIGVDGIYAGRYVVRVRAINSMEIASMWAVSTEVQLEGKTGKPPVPVNLRTTGLLWGIRIDWSIPTGAEDSLYTELQYAPERAGNAALLLSNIPYPQSTYSQMGLKAGQEFWYRVRLVDRIGNPSDWTEWLRGVSDENAGDYLAGIGDGFLTSKDGDALTSQIDQNIEGILQNALANNAVVEHQWAQYGEVRADILIVKTTIAEVDNAMAELSTTVQAQIEDVTATLEDKLTATVDADGATAIHTLKAGIRINGVYYSAGMSIAVLAENGKPVVTRIGFNANQFVLMSGEGDTQYSPFAVINGQVFISDAFIQYGQITLAKIGELRSSNYVQGKTGTIMKADGTFEINGGVEGEGGMKITNTTQSVKDGNNVLRVQIGKITGVF